MVKKQLVNTGIILALIGSNIITGKQYIEDTNKYEQKLLVKSKTIEQNKQKQSELVKKTVKNEQKITDLSNEINLLIEEKNKFKIENDKLKKAIPSRGEVKKQRQFYVEATAYGADCEGCSGLTYTGHNVKNTIYVNGLRVIASDNSILPLYSIVRVDAKNESFEAIVLDRGGGIKGYEIDVLMKSEKASLEFGRQKALITVLREGK